MRVTKYTTELDKDRKNILVKESAVNYDIGKANLSSAYDINKLMRSVFRLDKKAEEYVYILAFDNRLHLIGVFEASHGTVKVSLANPREIYIRALLCGASGIVLVHNHPSGETDPSREDITMTKRIIEAGKLLNVELLDHIIIGSYFTSLRETVNYLWEEK